MTYNFDPERWYENERRFLEQRRRSEGWSESEFEAALEDLERRYHQLVERLDGTYQIPDEKRRLGPTPTERNVNRPQRFEIRIAGFGGQGVVTIGKILGTAFSVYGGKNSVNTQSYGPESRGGACRSEVVVSDAEINYPYVRRADVLIALSQVAVDAYAADVKPDGILVIDPEAVKSLPKDGRLRIFKVPTVALAHEIGDVKYQNTVALGALYALISDLVAEAPLLEALRRSVPPKTLDLNRAAFDKGKHYVQTRMAEEG